VLGTVGRRVRVRVDVESDAAEGARAVHAAGDGVHVHLVFLLRGVGGPAVRVAEDALGLRHEVAAVGHELVDGLVGREDDHEVAALAADRPR
jgi:hypothetical protein